MLIKPRAGQAAKIKVVGVGGGGGNAISSMIADGEIAGVDFVAVNTDAQALLNNKATIKIQIGENVTKGLGSGGDPEIGRHAAEESRDRIKEELSGADMVFITAGEGGGTGTGASPIIAEVARENGALAVAVVTKPFEFEGKKRKISSDEGIQRLKEKVDTLIVVPNQKVLQIIDKKTSILEAFKKIDMILNHGVKGIAELITTPGLINVDFADVRSIMSNAGTALMGIGIGSGDKRAMGAIRQAISSPLLDISIEGARGVLLNIIGGPDLSMSEVNEAASIIAKTVDPDADIIFGAVIDEKMMDSVKITLIATKFDEGKLKFFRFKKDIDSDKTAVQPKIETVGDLMKKSKDYPDKNVMQSSPISDKTDEELLDDADEFDIPAFLRKK
jgi:cell division protein FtsZ